MSKTAVPWKTHLVVLLTCGDKVVAYRTLDMANGGYRPLLKELAYRAVLEHPQLAGAAWQLSLELKGVETSCPYLELQAWLESPRASPLAAIRAPIQHFAWLGVAMARQLGIAGEEQSRYHVQFAVPGTDHAIVQHEKQSWQGEDFAFAAESRSLRLPEGFSTQPLGTRKVLRDKASWIHCVFTEDAWRAFTAAAAAETSVERAWGATTRVHLAEGACSVVVPELVELEGKAGPACVIASGQETFSLSRRLGGDLGAFLHLHPRQIGQVQVTPHPSPADFNVAWDCEASSPTPVVLPIALFGAGSERLDQEVAAHAFVGGRLTEVTLEVLLDRR